MEDELNDIPRREKQRGQHLNPSQRFSKPPKYPGMSTLGSRNGSLYELPPQGTKRARPTTSLSVDINDAQVDDQSDSELEKAVSLVAAKFSARCRELCTFIALQWVGLIKYPRANRFWCHDRITSRLSKSDAIEIYTDMLQLDSKTINDFDNNFSRKGSFHEMDLLYLACLHEALMQDYHDFFTTTQTTIAQMYLKRLAVRYGTKRHDFKMKILAFLDIVRERSSNFEQMRPFVDCTYDRLDRLKKDVPEEKDSWNMIEENICQYLNQLNDSGFEVPIEYLNRRHPPDPPPPDPLNRVHDRDFPEDDDFREWYWQEYPQAPPTPPDLLPELYESVTLRLKEPVVLFMDGWLTFGGRIAKSFHSFCKTFKFMAWAGATF